jgi:hypothetical protein
MELEQFIMQTIYLAKLQNDDSLECSYNTPKNGVVQLF